MIQTSISRFELMPEGTLGDVRTEKLRERAGGYQARVRLANDGSEFRRLSFSGGGGYRK